MNSFSFVADTNFLIDINEGLQKTEAFLDGTVIVSVISEIELLGWHLLKEKDKIALESLLEDCVIIDLNAEIKKIAIFLRQQFRIKTPDAIIAATAKFLQIPLITSDKGFKSIPNLDLILI